ncbi:hypothetical protein BH18ACT6_BH18ACT6_17160 [soil metagenome]
MESRASPGPFNLRHHDAVIGCLREGGFSISQAVAAFSTLDSYVYGFALQKQTLPFESPEELAEVGESMLADFPVHEYPHLAETNRRADEVRLQVCRCIRGRARSDPRRPRKTP